MLYHSCTAQLMLPRQVQSMQDEGGGYGRAAKARPAINQTMGTQTPCASSTGIPNADNHAPTDDMLLMFQQTHQAAACIAASHLTDIAHVPVVWYNRSHALQQRCSARRHKHGGCRHTQNTHVVNPADPAAKVTSKHCIRNAIPLTTLGNPQTQPSEVLRQ